jgi:hypothetical protein
MAAPRSMAQISGVLLDAGRGLSAAHRLADYLWAIPERRSQASQALESARVVLALLEQAAKKWGDEAQTVKT